MLVNKWKLCTVLLPLLLLDGMQVSAVQPSHQTCQYGNTEIELSLYNGTHSAENLSTGCSLTRCSNTSGFCRPSPTPCFVYRTAYNRSYCAPASLCSGLVPCANSGNQCPSSRSVCVVNSCCSPAAVCLPLLWTELCPSTVPCQLGFQSMLNHPIGGSPQYVASGDFNTDNRTDLVVTVSSNDTINVFLGNGNGGFILSTVLSTELYPESVAVGDFNSDGYLDVVVMNIGTDSISLFFGDGRGNFLSRRTFLAASSLSAMAVSDFNNDRQLDIVFVSQGTNGVGVFLGNGGGNFSLLPLFDAGPLPQDIDVGDFNSDGQMDLIVTSPGNASANIFLGSGNGSFFNRINFPSGVLPRSIATADFNGDGRLDAAITDYSSRMINIHLGYGNGTFYSTPVPLRMTATPWMIIAHDLDGDQQTDIVATVVAGEFISVFLNLGNASIPVERVFGFNSISYGLTHGDFNTDGKEDLVVTSFVNRTVGVLLNDCV